MKAEDATNAKTLPDTSQVIGVLLVKRLGNPQSIKGVKRSILSLIAHA
jgi:hypothetical protein